MQRSLQTFMIQQVSEMLKIAKPTLRFWEKELEGVIVPIRTRGGQRRYTLEHLFVIGEVRKLKRTGHTLLDIKRRLASADAPRKPNSNSQGIDLLADRIAEIVRSAIHNIFEEGKLS